MCEPPRGFCLFSALVQVARWGAVTIWQIFFRFGDGFDTQRATVERVQGSKVK